MFVARAVGAARADDARRLLQRLGNPADVEHLGGGADRDGRLVRHARLAVVAQAGLRDAVDQPVGVGRARAQRRHHVHPHGEHVRVARHVLGLARVAHVQQELVALAQHRDLRAAVRPALAIEHAEHGPVRAGVGDLRHVAPGQRDAVAPVHGAQVARRIGVEEVPVRIRRHLGHAPHHHGGRQLDLLAGLDAVLLACEEAAERYLGTQQRAGEEAALEVAPGVQHVVGAEARRRPVRAVAELAAGGVGGTQPVAAVQHLVRDVRGQVELQARRVGPQRAVDVHHVGRVVEGAQHAAQLGVAVARQQRRPVEPAQLQPVVLAQPDQVLGRKREAPLAHLLGGAFEVGIVVARDLLVRADQQVRELAPAGAGLREQLGDGRLQQLLGKQEGRLERHRRRPAGALARGRWLRRLGGIEEPVRLALEHGREQREQVGRGHPLAALDHAQVGNRRRPRRIELDAARRQLLQRQTVGLAQRAQLASEKVRIAGVLGHEAQHTL